MVDKKKNHLAFTYIGDCPVYISRKNVKKYNFRIYSNCVKISVPKNKTDQEILEVIDVTRTRLISKILMQQRKVKNNKDDEIPNVITSILYLGKKRPVVFTDVEEPEYKDGEFLLPKDLRYEDYYTVEEQIDNLLRQLLRNIIKVELDKWEEKTGLKCKSFSVRKMRTLWGSVTLSKATMRFNFYLIAMPYDSISSVVIHELTHLKIKDHGKDYYKLLHSYMPDYDEADKILKETSVPLQYIF